jgi:hypothetical protein
MLDEVGDSIPLRRSVRRVDGHHLRVQGALEFMISGKPFNGARRIRGDRAKSLGPTGATY